MSLIEVIVVNDGSTDRSLDIAQSFARRYPNTFVVIDKQNNNYGSCINVALPKATGRYFRILDADDCYSTNALESFLDNLANLQADLIFTPFSMFEINRTRLFKIPDTIECGKVFRINDVDESSFIPRMHSMTYRTNLLLESRLTLSENVSYSDTEYCFFPLEYVSSIAFLNDKVYMYNASRDGQTTSPAALKRSTKSMDVVASRLLDYYTENKDVGKVVRTLWLRLLLQISELYYKTVLLHSEKNHVISEQLRHFDQKIQQVPDANSYISQLCEHHIHFVEMWRSKGRFYSCKACQVHNLIWTLLDPIWLYFLRKFYPNRL